mgnify:CR=1 FL=1
MHIARATKIVIIGSISMDLVMETSRIAQEGETVFGDRFSMVPGGKGANQAVAVGRLASKEDHITMLGAVGQDSYGPILLQNLEENGVSTAFVGTVPQSSGVAQITIFNQDNRIIYCPGANGTVDTDKWDKEWEGIAAADLVILQNEIPHESNLAIAQFCSEKGVKVLYNPGPARSTDKEMIDFVDYNAVDALKQIGIKYWNPAPKTTPIPWFNKHADTSKKQTALQESESTSYVIGVLTDTLDYDELPDF